MSNKNTKNTEENYNKVVNENAELQQKIAKLENEKLLEKLNKLETSKNTVSSSRSVEYTETVSEFNWRPWLGLVGLIALTAWITNGKIFTVWF